MYCEAICVAVIPPHTASNGVVAMTDDFDYAAVLRTMYGIVRADFNRGWRKVAEAIGYGDAAMWCRAAKGARLSRRAEDELRLMLGIAPRGKPDLDKWSPRTVRRYMAARRPYGEG